MSATLVTERDGSTLLSGSVAVPDGARAALLHLPERFRLDVQSTGDTLRTTVRHLAGGGAALGGPGYSGTVRAETDLGDLRASRYDLTLELTTDGKREEVRVLIGALHDLDAGLTTFSAQAIVERV